MTRPQKSSRGIPGSLYYSLKKKILRFTQNDNETFV